MNGSGTRSSLMYETIRIVDKLKPKYVVWENVKNVISKKHRHNFDNYIEKLNEGGYNSYYKVLNAKDYGIPQNRERVFTISIRKDIDKGDFVFPEAIPLQLKLKDMLEEEVDEKYYLSDRMINYIVSEDNKYKVNENLLEINRDIACSKTTKEGQTRADTSDYICDSNDENIRLKQAGQIYGTEKEPNPQDGRVWNSIGLSPTLDTMHQPKLLVKNATKQGYLEATEGDGIDISSRMEHHRGTVQKDMIQTLDGQGGNSKGVVVNG